MKKKLLLLLMAIMAAMPSLWAYELWGAIYDSSSNNNWSGNPMIDLGNSDAIYTANVYKGRNFQIRHDGSFIKSNDANTTVKIGSDLSTNWSGGNDWWFDSESGKYKFIFVSSFGNDKLWVEKVDSKPTTLYMHVGKNSGSNWNTVTSAQSDANSIFKFYLDATDGTSNKIMFNTSSSASNANNHYGPKSSGTVKTGDVTTTNSSLYAIFNSSNNHWIVDKGSYIVTVDWNNQTVKFEKCTELYLRGTMNEWGTDWRFNTTDGINYTLSGVNIPIGAQFKVSDKDWTGSNTYSFSNDADQMVDPNKSYTLANRTEDGTNMIMHQGVKNATVTFNANTKAFKITGTAVPTNYKYAIHNSMLDSNWGTPIALNLQDGKYVGAACVSAGEFIIKKYDETETDVTYFKSSNGLTFNGNTGANMNQAIAVTKDSGSNFKYTPKSGETNYLQFAFEPDTKITLTLLDIDESDFDYTVRGNGKIYFNAGAEYYSKPNEWNENVGLYAQFYSKGQEKDLVKMEKTDDPETPLFACDLPANMDGVNFYIYAIKDKATGEANKNDKKREFNTIASDPSETYHDSANWDKFIYGLGKNNAYQSYLTYNQWRKLVAAKGENGLFFLGENLYNGDYEVGSWDVSNLVPAVKDEGVYIMEMNFSNDADDKRFKVGFIDPEMVNPTAPYHENRWWATFNLGIVGVSRHIREVGKPDVELKPVGDNDASNSDVEYTAGITTMYNHYNQFNWLVKDAGETAYMVFDTKYSSVVILDFNPQPELRDLVVSEPETIDVTQAITDYAKMSGVKVNGSNDVNGISYYQNVNMVSGSATVIPAAADENFRSNHDIEYNLLHNSKELGTFAGGSGKTKYVTIESMVAGNDQKVAVRATYTDNRYLDDSGNPLKYRSRTSAQNAGTTVELGTVSADVQKVVLHNMNGTKYEDEATKKVYSDLDAVVEVSFTHDVENNGLACYPSFEIIGGPASSKTDVYTAGVLATEAHPYAVVDDTFDGMKYTPWFGTAEEGAYNEADHSWSNAAKEKGAFHFNVPAVVTGFEQGTNPAAVKVVGKISMVYPFLIKKGSDNFDVSETAPQSKPALRAPRRLGENGNIGSSEEYDIVEVPVDGDFEDEENSTLSGIENVEAVLAASAGGEEMLFNLQGVRVVDANPAPGIYVRRAADGSVSKVLVK